MRTPSNRLLFIICNQCGVLRADSEFKHRKSGPNAGDIVRPCVSCVNLNYKRRYHENPEVRNRALLNSSSYNKTNKEKRNVRLREWYGKNREHLSNYRKSWNKTRIEKCREQGRIHRANYQARKKKGGGSFTIAEWRSIVDGQRNQCAMCGIVCKLTIDHIIPVSKGGSSYSYNIQGLCLSCNVRKSDRIL